MFVTFLEKLFLILLNEKGLLQFASPKMALLWALGFLSHIAGRHL